MLSAALLLSAVALASAQSIATEGEIITTSFGVPSDAVATAGSACPTVGLLAHADPALLLCHTDNPQPVWRELTIVSE